MFHCIFSFVFIFIVVHGCQNDINTFNSCVQKRTDEQYNSMDQKRIENERKTRQCFKTKGCNEPIFTDDAQGKIGSEDLEEKCREQVIDDAKGQVETCMQRLVNGFHFPPKRNEQKKGTKGGSFGNHDKVINDSCPAGSRQAAKSCMSHSVNQSGDNCQAHDTCFKAMSAPCQSKVQKDLCSCAQSLNQKILDIEFGNCIGRATPTPGGHGGKVSPARSPVKSLVEKWCNYGNQCKYKFIPE